MNSVVLIVGVRRIVDLHRYALRWHDGNRPVLYLDGRRVTQAWALRLDVTQEADVEGANANTT